MAGERTFFTFFACGLRANLQCGRLVRGIIQLNKAIDGRDGRAGAVTAAGVTDGHGRPTTAAERTSNVKGLWNEQLARRGSVVEAPPGTLYRSADVTNDASSRGARIPVLKTAVSQVTVLYGSHIDSAPLRTRDRHVYYMGF